jgi:hypothetical protein
MVDPATALGRRGREADHLVVHDGDDDTSRGNQVLSDPPPNVLVGANQRHARHELLAWADKHF